MAKLTRDLYVVLIDRNKILGNTEEGFDWVRLKKSRIFEFDFGAQTETFGYIDAPNDVSEITGYEPSLPQEVVLDKDDPMFAMMDKFCMSFPIGSAAHVPFLLVRPSIETGEPVVGLLWEESTIVPNNLATIDGFLRFDIKPGGKMKKGTVTASEGTFVFAEDQA